MKIYVYLHHYKGISQKKMNQSSDIYISFKIFAKPAKMLDMFYNVNFS